MAESPTEQTIVFFDGVCHLCNAFVDFLVLRDDERHLQFAPLQGTTAARLLTPEQRQKMDSVLAWKQGHVLEKSSAVLAAFAQLGGGWKALSIVLQWIPQFLRDLVYDFVARHRYGWFGKSETCRLPTKEERGQILD